jgi:arabinogalactan endo-1,4-beta-galactosidase
VLTALRDSGVTPEWVQVGNEINDGMLWEDGRASTNPAHFSAMVAAGAAAVKAISPGIQVVVHISNGYDNALFRWMFDLLKANNVKWDAIGMSLYPSTSNWRSYDSLCLSNMKDMVLRYGSKVLVSEVGMAWNQPDTAYAMLTRLLANTKSVAGGLGVFYWEPESYNGWQGYTLGAFDNSGKPTKALDAFLVGATTSIAPPRATAEFGDLAWQLVPSGLRLHSTGPVDWRVLDLGGREFEHGRSQGDALVAQDLPQGEWILSLRTAAGARSVLIPRP